MACQLSSADLALASRLEAAEAANALALTLAAAGHALSPVAVPFAGGTAVFAGVGSPMTHALGIGLRGHVPESELEQMEAFFRELGSPSLIDLCPLADPSVVAFVQSRPYHTIEFNNILARRIRADERFEPQPRVREAARDEAQLWSRVVAEGFSEHMPVVDEVFPLMSAIGSACRCFFACDSEPVGGAALGVQDGVALLFGDATLTRARGRGLQSSLIQHRLAEAQRAGCDLAMAAVLPGSGSHRNYERAGFELVYMRVNLMREFQ